MRACSLKESKIINCIIDLIKNNEVKADKYLQLATDLAKESSVYSMDFQTFLEKKLIQKGLISTPNS